MQELHKRVKIQEYVKHETHIGETTDGKCTMNKS